jgi:poly(A) polymerase
VNELDTALQRLARFAQAEPALNGVYVVGGALRNALLGRPFVDVDLVAPGDASHLARAAAEALGTHVVTLGDRFPLYRLPVPGGAIDIAPVRGAILDDLAERDFTVNAMALPLEAVHEHALSELDAGTLIDPYGGRDDLARGVVRLVSREALLADPVRALRAVRIACEAGLKLHPSTRRALADPALRPAVTSVAAERNGAELQRIFASDRAALGVRSLDRTRLLTAYLPALEAGREVDQRPVHRYPVLEHQLVAL